MVVTETKLSGARANEIIETLPFDGAVVTNTIGFRRYLVDVEIRHGSSGCLGNHRTGNPCYYPEANVTHLAKVNSDHCPLLLNLNPNMGSASNRPFKFQSIWLSHNDFPTIVREAWIGKEADLAGAITGFMVKAQRWNKEVFGNVFNRKKQIMARSMGTQRALANNPNNFLLKLQDQLFEEYNLILQLEEEIWAMKSKSNVTIFRERNTKYFHMSTLARRSKNRITSVQSNEDEWIHEVEEVKEVFISSFKKLYQTEQCCCPLNHQRNSGWCVKLNSKEANNIAHIPSDEEIWNALKSMKPYKALGSDGLHAGFFLRFWLVVGESVKKEVRGSFVNQKVPNYLN
ncbi:hypothetical protein SO802_012145 [Lithocarpus litseifolius]|uniref:Reverse transcriptase n=1 Tax=Lithocarpus litseifolius TaxID=425828 RepID=A0AAW2D4K6_9ROSI